MSRTHVFVLTEEAMETIARDGEAKLVSYRNTRSEQRPIYPGDIIYFSTSQGLVHVRAEVGHVSFRDQLPDESSIFTLNPEDGYASGYLISIADIRDIFPRGVLEERPVSWTTYDYDPVEGDLVDVMAYMDGKIRMVDRIVPAKARRLVAEGLLSQKSDRVFDLGTRPFKAYVVQRDHCRCRYCGVRLEPRQCTVDHVIPKLRKTDNRPSNLVTACYDCNLEKAHLTPREMLALRRAPEPPTLTPEKVEGLIFTNQALRDINELDVTPEAHTNDKVSWVRKHLSRFNSAEHNRSTIELYAERLRATVAGMRYIIRVEPIAS